MDAIEKLKQLFSQFPTVGQRTAGRFVYYLLKLPQNQIKELTAAIEELSQKIKLCQLCFNPFEGEGTVCAICKNAERNKNLLCIVEKETDLLSVESSKKYNGVYFILGGVLGAMSGENTENIRKEPLLKRVQSGEFTEIIIALNPTPEGRATSTFIEKMLKDSGKNFSITHLARGIPVGGELEYADPETLESAIEGRK